MALRTMRERLMSIPYNSASQSCSILNRQIIAMRSAVEKYKVDMNFLIAETKKICTKSIHCSMLNRET